MENYLLAMGVYAGLYALMALGLNVIWGLAGMVNLGLVGFFAIGAYAEALLTVRLHWTLFPAWLAATLIASLAGGGVALLTARLRGDYLAIVTLGFAEVIRLVASNEVAWTNGTDGISGIPAPFRTAVSPTQFNLLSLAVVWAMVLIAALKLGRLSLSPFGRVLRAIREDEMVAAVAGKPVLRFKVQAFASGAGALGLAGAMYATYNSYVAPDAFQPLVTLYIILALTIGGTGSMRGAILGGVIVIALTEGTRFAGGALPFLRPVQVAALREGLIGLMLIAVLMLRPDGLIPERPRRYQPEPP